MRGMFKDNLPLAEYVLRTILDKEDLNLESFEIQADFKRVTGARSVCFDGYASDSEGKIYDIEVQKDSSGASPERARYHSSTLDIGNLDGNQDFSELPETYVIFITEEDYFGEGKPVYVIEDVNRTTGKPFNDRRHILYVNASYNDLTTEIGKLMHDFLCDNPDEMLCKPMAERAGYLKGQWKGVKEMCDTSEEIREEGRREVREEMRNLTEEIRQEGREKGREEGRIEGLAEGQALLIMNMFRNGMSIEQISSVTDMDKSEVKQLVNA
jgi:predicted transposase/invertase (TIGR01784 family)